MSKELIIASDTHLAQYGRAVKEGLELSSGARSTSTYYHTKDEQITAIRKKVNELYKVDKSIPLLLASMQDSTNFFRQEVLRKELASGYLSGPQGIVNPSIWIDEGMQENMVNHVLQSLPFTYTLRLFVSFKDLSINNSRSRNKILKWIMANLNDFSVVKYRNKIGEALKHAYGQRTYSAIIKNLGLYLNGRPHDADMLNSKVFRHTNAANELTAKLLMFVARKGEDEWYGSMKYTKAFYKACDARTKNSFYKAAALLDFHTVTGIISSYPNTLFRNFMEGGKLKDEVKAKLLEGSKVQTDDQKVRTKRLQKAVGGTERMDVDYSKVQTETLYKTKGVKAERKQRAQDNKISLPYTNIGVIKDVSLSNRGGKDSANTPAAIIDHLADVLKASAPTVTVKKTPKTQTDLSAPFVKILKDNPDVQAVFVLSDGYENYPYEGCFNDLVGRFNKRGNVQVVHCSPYVSAEMKAKARNLGSNVISMAINTPAQITTQMEVRLLDFNPKVYFEKQFNKYVEVGEQSLVAEDEIIL